MDVINNNNNNQQEEEVVVTKIADGNNNEDSLPVTNKQRCRWKTPVWTVAADGVTYSHPIFKNENVQDLNYLKILVADPPYEVPRGKIGEYWISIQKIVRNTTESNAAYGSIAGMSLDALKNRYKDYISRELETSMEKSGVNSGDKAIDTMLETSGNGKFEATERNSDDKLPVALQIYRLIHALCDGKKQFEDTKNHVKAAKAAAGDLATKEGNLLMDVAIGAYKDDEDEELFLDLSKEDERDEDLFPSNKRMRTQTPCKKSPAFSDITAVSGSSKNNYSTSASSSSSDIAMSVIERKKRKDELKALKIKKQIEQLALKRERAAAQDEQQRRSAEMNAELQRGMLAMFEKFLPKENNDSNNK
jgi:hypothetical protein